MEPKISAVLEIYIEILKEPVKSEIYPAKYGPTIWPILKEEVRIAAETINDPGNLFCPSSKLIAVIGIKVKPNKIAENKK